MAKNDAKKTAGAAAPDAKESQADKGAQAEGATTGTTEITAGDADGGAAPGANELVGRPANTAEQSPADAVQQVGSVSDTQIEELSDSLPAKTLDSGALTSLAWPPQLFDVRILAPVTIRDVRYQPNTVLEGLPLALVDAHLDSVDPHPEAVDYARANGGEVIEFQRQDRDEDQE